MAIPSAAKDSDSAKLMADYLLSRKGQIELAAGGRVPFRPDISPADVNGQFTYSSILAEIGEENAAYVDYDPKLVTGHEARSEEHTPELQSLMRTSYGVFCLNKKKN